MNQDHVPRLIDVIVGVPNFLLFYERAVVPAHLNTWLR